MLNVLLVFTGGGLGALLRWSISIGVSGMTSRIWLATFLVNLIGCAGLFLVGRILNSETSQLFVRVAFFGSLTTFSSFSFEVVTLIKSGRMLEAACVVGLNVFSGILVGILVFR